jgi:hypothetical protein
MLLSESELAKVYNKKRLGYCEIPNAETSVYKLTIGDLQMEAQERLGRLLNENEISRAEKILEYGLGETISPIYNGIFEIFEEEKLR